MIYLTITYITFETYNVSFLGLANLFNQWINTFQINSDLKPTVDLFVFQSYCIYFQKVLHVNMQAFVC